MLEILRVHKWNIKLNFNVLHFNHSSHSLPPSSSSASMLSSATFIIKFKPNELVIDSISAYFWNLFWAVQNATTSTFTQTQLWTFFHWRTNNFQMRWMENVHTIFFGWNSINTRVRIQIVRDKSSSRVQKFWTMIGVDGIIVKYISHSLDSSV